MKQLSTGLPSEAEIQIQLVEYLNLIAAKCGFLFFAVSNEAMGRAQNSGGLARMAKLKRMGMRHGVADLVFVKDGEVYFLEMKSAKGVQSEHQKEFENDAKKNGAPYALAHSFDEAVFILQAWDIIP